MVESMSKGVDGRGRMPEPKVAMALGRDMSNILCERKYMAFLVSMLCYVTTLCPFPSSCNWRERRKNRGQICRYSSRGDGVGGPDRRVCSMLWHTLAAVASPIADADGGEVERNKCTLRLGTDSTSIPTRGKQSANFHSSAQDTIFISELFWPKFISVDICSILNCLHFTLQQVALADLDPAADTRPRT